MNPPIQKIEITWTSLWRVSVFCAMVAVLYFAWQSFSILLVGVMVSLGIEPLVGFMAERMKLGRVLSAILVVILLVAIFAGAAYLIMPVIFTELGGFLSHFTQALHSIVQVGIPGIDSNSLNLDQILNLVGGVGGSVQGALSGIFMNILLLFSAIIITLYLSIEEKGAEKMIRVLLPDVYEQPVMAIFGSFKLKMRRWLGTQLVFSLFIGLAVGLGMWFIGVRYALILGILAAIFELVPIIGPVVTGAVAFLVAVSDSTILGLYAVIFFFVVQQFENHVLIPLVVGKSMRVHPVIAVVSLLVGGQLAGFVGIILGIPIAVLVQEIFNYLAARKEKRSVLEL